MTALATADDVAARWRTLTDEEETRAEVYLEDASAELRRLRPDVDDWIADGDIEADLVVGRVAWAVIRLMMNPERLKALTIGATSETYNLSDSGFWFTESDLALITPGTVGDAYTISVLSQEIMDDYSTDDDDLWS